MRRRSSGNPQFKGVIPIWWLPFVPKILDLLIKRNDPSVEMDMKKVLVEIEAQAREAEAKAEAARADEYARFIEATTPKSENVYMWINSLISLVRPSMAVMAFIAPWAWPKIWESVLHSVAANAPYSIVMLVPLWAFVLGRDGLRMVVGAIAAFRSGTVPPGTMPPGIPIQNPQPPVKPVLKPPVKPQPPLVVAPDNGLETIDVRRDNRVE